MANHAWSMSAPPLSLRDTSQVLEPHHDGLMVSRDAVAAILENRGALGRGTSTESCVNLRAPRVGLPAHKGRDLRVGLREEAQALLHAHVLQGLWLAASGHRHCLPIIREAPTKVRVEVAEENRNPLVLG